MSRGSKERLKLVYGGIMKYGGLETEVHFKVPGYNTEIIMSRGQTPISCHPQGMYAYFLE